MGTGEEREVGRRRGVERSGEEWSEDQRVGKQEIEQYERIRGVQGSEYTSGSTHLYNKRLSKGGRNNCSES